MPDATNPDEIVTLTCMGELPQAELLCGRLDAEGVECFLPDEQMARQAWQLRSAIGGIRVQVRRADLERAREILAEPGVAPSDLAPADANGDSDDGTISDGDRAAHRALRVALVSLLLMGLVHPYSAWLALRALGRKDVTPWGQRRAGIALLVSFFGCTWMGILAYHLYRLGS